MLISSYNVPSREMHNKSVLVWLCSETECSGRLGGKEMSVCLHTHTHTQAVSSACSVLFVRARLYLNQAVCCLSSPRLCVTLPFANELRLLSKTCDSRHRGGMDVFLEALFLITWSDSVWRWGDWDSSEAELYECHWCGNQKMYFKKPEMINKNTVADGLYIYIYTQ